MFLHEAAGFNYLKLEVLFYLQGRGIMKSKGEPDHENSFFFILKCVFQAREEMDKNKKSRRKF